MKINELLTQIKILSPYHDKIDVIDDFSYLIVDFNLSDNFMIIPTDFGKLKKVILNLDWIPKEFEIGEVYTKIQIYASYSAFEDLYICYDKSNKKPYEFLKNIEYAGLNEAQIRSLKISLLIFKESKNDIDIIKSLKYLRDEFKSYDYF